MKRPLLLVDLGAKVLLLGLLAHAAAFPDLPQYTGKGMGYRLALYPLSALLVPAVWALRRRRKPATAYPAHIDLCLVLPFLMDTAGNAANLYDTQAWWDDLMHVTNWIPLVMAVGFCIRYRQLSRPVVAGLTVGFGAVIHILWEVGEYLTFVQDNPSEAASAYRDTIGDLVGSLSGSIIGAALVVLPRWRGAAPEPHDVRLADEDEAPPRPRPAQAHPDRSRELREPQARRQELPRRR